VNGLPRLSVKQSVIVGRNVRVLRKRAGWTLADLGKRLGKDSSTVYRMEKGERRISYADVALLADIFEVPAADLVAQCHNCHGSPPPGFACLVCGPKDSEPSPDQDSEPSPDQDSELSPDQDSEPPPPPVELSVPAGSPGPYLTVAEVAKVLRVSRKVVLGLARRGELGNIAEVGPRTLRIPESGVNALLRSHSSQTGHAK